jgi:hypothetical protein
MSTVNARPDLDARTVPFPFLQRQNAPGHARNAGTPFLSLNALCGHPGSFCTFLEAFRKCPDFDLPRPRKSGENGRDAEAEGFYTRLHPQAVSGSVN